MNRLLITLTFLTILYCQCNICAVENIVSLEQKAIFKYDDTGSWVRYSKREDLGCTTKLSIRGDQLRIISDMECYRINNKNENINEIAKSASELVDYFKLKNRIKTIKTLGVVLGREHLLRAINNDESWPKDIQSYVKEKYKNSMDIHNFVKNKIVQVIIESKIYDPIVSVLGKYGCNVDLKRLNIDGLFVVNNPLTKEKLIEQKVFTEEEVKKDTFPDIKDMWFDVKWQKQ